MKRFYKEVSVLTLPLREGRTREARSGRGNTDITPHRKIRAADFSLARCRCSPPSRGETKSFSILLDGKPIKTPLRATLALPTRALAEAVAEEWRGQGELVVPTTMWLTKLANTAIDRVMGQEEHVIAQVLAYANDLLCYRAQAPAGLVARQNKDWDPLLEWAAERHGARLLVRAGISHIAQPEEAVAALRRALAEHDPFVLTALHAAATICGSLVLALALADGRLDAEEAFALSRLDERYQAERWGVDEEAEMRARVLAAELAAAARFMLLSKGEPDYAHPSTSSG